MLKTEYSIVMANQTPLHVLRLIERDIEVRIAVIVRTLREHTRANDRAVFVGNLKELRRMRRQLARYEYDEKEGRGRFTLAYDVTRREGK